jgi:hypothetical protein
MSSQVGNLQVTSFTAAPERWVRFQALAASQHLTASALLRMLIAKELRRAAKQDAAFVSGTSGLRRETRKK